MFYFSFEEEMNHNYSIRRSNSIKLNLMKLTNYLIIVLTIQRELIYPVSHE